MILDNIAGCADSVIVARATTDANVFGHGDLHVIYVIGVPQWLKKLIRKPERKNVLHGLFAKVVVDSEDRVCRKNRFNNRVQFACRSQVVPKGFLNYHPAKLIRLGSGQSASRQLLADDFKSLGRNR